MNTIGDLSIVLHAHLPFIHHPEYDGYLEEEWFFEAISETYIPLLKIFSKLEKEGVAFKLTMTLTPSLLSMMDSDILKKRYIDYLNQRIDLGLLETKNAKNKEENYLSKYYLEKFKEDLKFFTEDLNFNLINKFKYFMDKGFLEIITCGATHGFFPIISLNEKALRAQIKIGVDTYKKYFNKNPKGIWLPECAYVPEVDKYLKEFNILYTIVETHGLMYANPFPVNGTYTPITSPEGMCFFARDLESSRQVWSSISGYPGDANYRDFYRDLGYDRPYEYIKPFLPKSGVRVHTGFKYYRITGKDQEKQLYNINWAKETAERHASHFLESRIKQIENISKYTTQKPIILSPYDAELFGHWWYEGPYFLYILFKKIYYDQNKIKLTTPSIYLDENPNLQVSQPASTTWGANGYNEVWLNHLNDYAHKHILKLADDMTAIASKEKEKRKKEQKKEIKQEEKPKKENKEEELRTRVLNQMVRELLLLQSSDWLFIITNGTMTEYAHKRIKEHTGRFNKFLNMLKTNSIDEDFLNQIEQIDNIFPDVNYLDYA